MVSATGMNRPEKQYETKTNHAKHKNALRSLPQGYLLEILLIEGTEISTMAELTNWIVDNDKVLMFKDHSKFGVCVTRS